MAYGLKYNLVFRDSTVISNKLWQLNIYKNGWSGSSTSVIGDDSPVQISYKKQSLTTAICGSECTVNLQAASAGQFDDFLTAEPLAYYIDVQYSTDGGSTWTTWWSGVNTTDTYTQAHSNVPYPVSLKFNCGLGELQWHRYESSGQLFDSQEQVVQLVSNCMTFLPYTKNIREICNVREDTMNDAKGLFEQLYVNDTAFYEIGNDGLTHGINCNKLLNMILTSINCRIYQSNNMWFVERIYDRINSSVIYFDYTASSAVTTTNGFTHSATGTLNWSRAINNSSYPKLTTGSEKAVTQKQPVLTYKYNPSITEDLQLIPNPYFDNIATAVTYAGKNPIPLRWDRSSSVQSVGGDELETVDPFETDVNSQSGYSWGSSILSDNQTWVLANVPNFWGNAPYNFGVNPSAYYIHASRRPGSAVTVPYMMHDPDNSIITANIRQYFRFKYSPNYIVSTSPKGPTWSQCWNDAGLLLGGYPNCITPFIIKMTRIATGDVFYLTGQQQIQNPNNSTWYKGTANGIAFTIQTMFFELNSTFAHQIGYKGKLSAPATGAMTQNQLATLIQKSWNGSSCTPFYIAFDAVSNYTIGFNNSPGNPFPDTPQPYSFDLVAYPAVFNTVVPSGLNTPAAVDDYALCNVDMQYKNNAQSATNSVSFYSSPDASLRWNELVINASIGDTSSTGFPGSFSVASGNNTGTWHALGALPYLFDTSTSSGSPSSGYLRFNNATLASVTHIYINDTDFNSNNDSSLFASLSTGASLTVSDLSSGTAVVFTVSSVTADSGYYDIGVSVVSSSGAFSGSDNLQFIYLSGQLLVDVFFGKFAQIVANYRNNLRGNVIYDNTLQFFHSIEDEDGTLYIQLGHTFEPKPNKYQTDMEGMADLGVTITPIHTLPTKPFVKVVPIPTPPGPIHPIISAGTLTPVKAVSLTTTTANTAYPI